MLGEAHSAERQLVLRAGVEPVGSRHAQCERCYTAAS